MQRGHIQHVSCLGMEQRDMVTQEMGGNGKAQGRVSQGELGRYPGASTTKGPPQNSKSYYLRKHKNTF